MSSINLMENGNCFFTPPPRHTPKRQLFFSRQRKFKFFLGFFFCIGVMSRQRFVQPPPPPAGKCCDITSCPFLNIYRPYPLRSVSRILFPFLQDAIAELSLDKAVAHLSASTAAAGAHSAEAVLRLIAVVSQCADLLTDAQICQLFPALRAHRLRGIDAAEKVKRRNKCKHGGEIARGWHNLEPYSWAPSPSFSV